MADIQSLLDALPAGSTLVLDPGTHTLAGPLTKPITLTTRRPLAPARAIDADVTLISPTGVVITAPDVTFRGVAVQCTDPTKNIVQALGARFTLDRGLITGSPTLGGRRGLAINSAGGRVLSSTIDQCWRPDTEGQAVLGWDGTSDWLFEDCLLGGASQSLMLGGADATTASRVPANVTIRHCDLVKRAEWGFRGAMQKTSFELKAGLGVTLSDCVFDGAGTGQGQGAYLMVLKSCNQDGHAPWSSTQHVVIERFTAKHGGGCVSFVGNDGANPSITMGSITLRDGTFSDIDPTLYPGSPGRGFTFQSAAIDVTLENIVVTAQNMAASMYLIGPPPKRLVLRNVQLPQSLYGVKIDGGPSLKTPDQIVSGIKAWAPDAIVEGITVV